MKKFRVRDGNLTFDIFTDERSVVTAKMVRRAPGADGVPRTTATVTVKHGDVFDLKTGIHQAIRAAKIRSYAMATLYLSKMKKHLRAQIYAGRVMRMNPFQAQKQVG